jgi:hypothetical protein
VDAQIGKMLQALEDKRVLDYTVQDSKPLYVELFDHRIDPDEKTNIAKNNPELVKALLRQFNSGW